MSSYNAVILGGTSGFGKYITSELLKQEKFNIIILGLNKPLKKNRRLKFFKCNLSKIDQIKNSISRLEKKIKKIDILILNSGSFFLKKEIIDNKYEKTFLVNFYSQYLLIKKLKKKILRSNIRKIIIISSHVIVNHSLDMKDIQSLNKFNFWKSYKNSKTLLFFLANYLFLKEKKKISYLFFNPGRIKTNLGSNLKIIGFIISLYHKIFGENPELISKRLIKYLMKNLNKHKLFKFKGFQNTSLIRNLMQKNRNRKILINYVYKLSKNI
tara:strand:+ start:6032 stop:6838 length:807 start_codon:yes stop_codon:yes gene_type:complete